MIAACTPKEPVGTKALVEGEAETQELKRKNCCFCCTFPLNFGRLSAWGVEAGYPAWPNVFSHFFATSLSLYSCWYLVPHNF